MPRTPVGPGGGPGGGTPGTVLLSQWFSSLHEIAWFMLTPTQFFGQNGELGNDFGMPANSIVGSAHYGKVVAVWQDPAGSSIGTIVQVQGVNGDLWHYQHLRSSSVQVGQLVFPGTPIGTSGGCPTGCYDPNNHNDCKCYDNYSTNPHIEVRYAPSYNPSAGMWNQHWVDPRSIFVALQSEDYAQADSGDLAGAIPQGTPGADGNCVHSISWSNPGVGPLGGGQTTICMDPAIDFAARGVLIVAALILAVMAIYLFTHQSATLQSASADANSKMQSAVSSAAALAAL